MKKIVLIMSALLWAVLLVGCRFFAPPEDIDLTYEEILADAQSYVEQYGEQFSAAVRKVAEEMEGYDFREDRDWDDSFDGTDIRRKDRELSDWWDRNGHSAAFYPDYGYCVRSMHDAHSVVRWEIRYYYTWDFDLFQGHLNEYPLSERPLYTDLGNGWWLYAKDTYAGRK